MNYEYSRKSTHTQLTGIWSYYWRFFKKISGILKRLGRPVLPMTINISQKTCENIYSYIVKLFIQYGVLSKTTINSQTRWLINERETISESLKQWTVS